MQLPFLRFEIKINNTDSFLFDSMPHALFTLCPFNSTSFKWLISSKVIDGCRASQLGFQRKICFCFAMMSVFSRDTSPLSCLPGLDTLARLGPAWTLNSRFYKVVCLSGPRKRCTIPPPKYLVRLSYIVSINSIWQFLYNDTSLSLYVLRQCMIIVHGYQQFYSKTRIWHELFNAMFLHVS